MARFVKITALDGRVASVNPDHVALIAPHQEGGKTIIGVSVVVSASPAVLPIVTRGGVEEITDLLSEQPAVRLT